MKIKRNDMFYLIVLWCTVELKVIGMILTEFELNFDEYVSYGLLVLLTIFKLYNFNRYKIFFTFFLFLISLNLLNFSIVAEDVNFILMSRPFYLFDPIFALVLLFYIVENRKNISDFYNTIEDSKKTDNNIKIELLNEPVSKVEDKYYNELQGMTDKFISNIINNSDDFQVKYVRAALRIYNDRNLEKKSEND